MGGGHGRHGGPRTGRRTSGGRPAGSLREGGTRDDFLHNDADGSTVGVSRRGTPIGSAGRSTVGGGVGPIAGGRSLGLALGLSFASGGRTSRRGLCQKIGEERVGSFTLCGEQHVEIFLDFQHLSKRTTREAYTWCYYFRVVHGAPCHAIPLHSSLFVVLSAPLQSIPIALIHR